MQAFIENIVWNFQNINWEGPAMFIIIVMAILSVFRQWHILLLTLLTIVLGWGAGDIILMNIETNTRIASLALVIYCCGGGLALILSLFAFLKFAIE